MSCGEDDIHNANSGRESIMLFSTLTDVGGSGGTLQRTEEGNPQEDQITGSVEGMSCLASQNT